MIPRTSAFAWAATFLGLSGPFIEPMYFRARSSRVFALRGRRVIARMSVKAQLVAKISEIIRSQDLTQVEAARILGVT
jgi:hypothetical protein